jgi:trans-aconitate 2-methyltransferase
VAEDLARSSPFAEHLGGYIGHRNVLAPERYAEILDEIGFAELRVRLEVYCHRLTATASVVEWVKGTLLTGFAERLPGELYRRFEQGYQQRLLERLGDGAPYLYPFKRILLWACSRRR